MPQTIDIHQSAGGRLTITLKRPERGNAFDQTMLDELGEALLASETDAGARLLVLRAQGRHFCTGADMSSRGATDRKGLSLNDVLSRLDGFAKPTVALVQGGCLGGGLGLAACCDIVLATPAAFFCIPELRVGIAPSRQLAGLLLRAMGPRAMRRYGLTGERISAHEAFRLGLVHEILDDDAEARLDAISREICLNAPLATMELKASLATFSSPGRDEIFPPGGIASRGLARSPEAIEGLAAFREKRRPAWAPKDE